VTALRVDDAPRTRPTRPVGRRPRRWMSVVRAVRGLLPLIALLLIWQFLGDGDPLRFPKPSLWWPAVTDLQDQGVLLPAVERSLSTFLIGLAVATVAGVVLGLLIGSSRTTERALGPLFDFIRGLPVPVLVPVTILLLGVGFSTNVTIVAFAVVWPVLLNTIKARRSIPQVRIDSARILNLGGAATLAKVVLPSIFSSAMVGLRISASLGVITTLVVEMLAGGGGVGFLLLERQARFDAAGMWGLLALVGVFGFLLNAALTAVGRIGWAGRG
jgi:ABC-type nitrate/sulfonate/bicarbonate transport system permease component